MGNKSSKKITVAVSGGFDPPHSGHIEMFRAAKKLGDELVVIINNDNWIRAKKDHAFMPEQERKAIIEEFECVDKVVLTKHEENPKDMSVVEALREVKPDIFANGGDRKKHNTLEGAAADEIGYKMAFNVGGGKIQSSSWILKEYLEKHNIEK
ncbi:MAG: adenylyltransferase/cytidyltransferase family protein [Candidatus Spechtbacterales bacterium]|nr:adenylyltransferase/cytidyltransferase family protein [Candidatus Spechtbacterales bacterium]